jgi:hypothetical protein
MAKKTIGDFMARPARKRTSTKTHTRKTATTKRKYTRRSTTQAENVPTITVRLPRNPAAAFQLGVAVAMSATANQ